MLEREDGTTVIEQLTNLAILGAVLAGLTTIVVSGQNAELRQTQRVSAQQEARLAVVRMRKEIHCAKSVSAGGGAVASVAATIPAACLGLTGSDITVTYQTASVATGRWKLERVQGSSTLRVADFLTSSTPFTYTAPTSSTRGSLRVDLRVDIDPAKSPVAWNLVDDIVLRNNPRA